MLFTLTLTPEETAALTATALRNGNPDPADYLTRRVREVVASYVAETAGLLRKSAMAKIVALPTEKLTAAETALDDVATGAKQLEETP